MSSIIFMPVSLVHYNYYQETYGFRAILKFRVKAMSPCTQKTSVEHPLCTTQEHQSNKKGTVTTFEKFTTWGNETYEYTLGRGILRW